MKSHSWGFSSIQLHICIHKYYLRWLPIRIPHLYLLPDIVLCVEYPQVIEVLCYEQTL